MNRVTLYAYPATSPARHVRVCVVGEDPAAYARHRYLRFRRVHGMTPDNARRATFGTLVMSGLKVTS